MEIDWKTDGSGTYPLYPKGTYKVGIKSWENTIAGTGTTQIRWNAIIVDGDFDGGSIVEHNALVEKAKFRLVNFVSCHVDKDTLPKMEVGSPTFNGVLDMCVGRTMYWNVDVRTYNGKEKNEIVEYLRDEEMPLQDGLISTNEEPDFLKED